jgi:hypothetical protein
LSKKFSSCAGSHRVAAATLVELSEFAFAPAANAEIVTNGGFATGEFTGWNLYTPSNGDRGSSGSGLPAAFNVTGYGVQAARRSMLVRVS